MVRRGEAALRDRLARPSVSDRRATLRGVAGAGPPELSPAGEVAAAAVAAASADETAASATVLAEPFLPLTALDRILQPSPQRDRTFLFALIIVALLHVVTFVGAVELSDAAALQIANKGQVDTENVVTVELVSAPDRDAKTVDINRAELGDPNKVPPERTQPAPEQQQQKPQDAVQPQQQQKAEKAEQAEQAAKAEKPEGKDPGSLQPVTPDEGPGLMASLDPKTAPKPKEAAKAQEAKEERELKEEREAREASQPNKVLQLRSAAPKGQKVYEGLVYKALFKTEPQIWFNRAEVMVAFVVSPTGQTEHITIVRSSNDKIFDDVVFEWIKRARLPPPPQDASTEDRIFSFRYVIQ